MWSNFSNLYSRVFIAGSRLSESGFLFVIIWVLIKGIGEKWTYLISCSSERIISVFMSRSYSQEGFMTFLLSWDHQKMYVDIVWEFHFCTEIGNIFFSAALASTFWSVPRKPTPASPTSLKEELCTCARGAKITAPLSALTSKVGCLVKSKWTVVFFAPAQIKIMLNI